MHILIGLEKEFFIHELSLEQGKFLSAKDAKLGEFCDECGYLAEIRGEPKNNIVSAIFSLREAEYRLRKSLQNNITILNIPYAKIPSKDLHRFRREFGKGAAHDECMYKEIKEKNIQTAGMHIHFSNYYKEDIHCNCGKNYSLTHEMQLNMPRIIKELDHYFEKIIVEAKRQKGIYEMKSWGFEYRSLPNNVNEELLIAFFEKFKFEGVDTYEK